MKQCQPDENQAASIERLKKVIEAKVGRKIQTPKDFDYLAACIEEELHDPISVSTLKRLWGYIQSFSSPRFSTLNALAQFVGSESWEAFCRLCETEDETPSAPSVHDETSSGNKKRSKTWIVPFYLIALLICGFFIWRHVRPQQGNESDAAAGQQSVLRSGQVFSSTSDYLNLFGITSTSHPWSQPLPHHDGIIIWGPKYHHPEWHNEGTVDSLMPFITEYWTPADSDNIPAEIAVARNKDNYLRATTFNELRITFMKGIVRDDETEDSTYTFLGIYRLNLEKSDSSRLVWQRIAEECDLSNLDDLEQLRY